MAKSVSERTATAVARLTTDAQSAAHMQDVLAECLDSESVAVSRTEEPDGRWSLALHFREQPNESAVCALIAAAMKGATAPALQFETLAATDWVRESRLPPVEAGRFVVHGAHDRARVPVNRIGIEIEAGLAFGTGHHGSTRGCLLALHDIAKRWSKPRRLQSQSRHRGRRRAVSNGDERRWRGLSPLPEGERSDRACAIRVRGSRRPKGPFSPLTRNVRASRAHSDLSPTGRGKERCTKRTRILDVGTGSGVLAIAAAKALHRPVLAGDIDRRAVMTARDNMRLNGVGTCIEVLQADGLCRHRFVRSAPFELILANILLDPLKQLATPMASLTARNGLVVLSGLLNAQASPAIASYRARGFAFLHRITLAGWSTLVLAHRPARRRS